MFTICGCPQMEHISPAAAWYFLFICVRFSARRAENRTLTIIKYRSAEGKKSRRIGCVPEGTVPLRIITLGST